MALFLDPVITIVEFIVELPLFITIFVPWKHYKRTGLPVFKYLAINWSFAMAYFIFLFLGKLLLNNTLILLACACWIPIGYFMMLIVDSISRERVDTVKLIVVTGISVALIVFIFTKPVSADGPPSPSDEAYLFTILLALFTQISLVYYHVQILRHAPKNLEKYPAIALGGLTLTGTNLFLAAITPYGFNVIFTIGSLMWVLSYGKEPRLATILSTRALRLMVIHSEAGLPLFSHTWSHGREMADTDIFSGMIQGISMIMMEGVRRGHLRSIELEEGVMLMIREEKFPVAYVLVATNVTKMLRHALETFSVKFTARYSQYLDTPQKISVYNSASDLVEECFPFVPDYTGDEKNR